MSDSRFDDTRRSWNHATALHNAHKGDQAAFLRDGGELLFDEELALLGPLAGRDVLHLQCNAGHDSLCLARRGARVHGVDLADAAIRFARKLSADSGIPASFECAEALGFLAHTDLRFDLVFSSYGAVGWLPDLEAWARGLRRVLRPGGRFVYVEFHPLVWSFGPALTLTGDDYFSAEPFNDPVPDYVAPSGSGLGATEGAVAGVNPHRAWAYQYGLGDIVTALAQAGLTVQRLTEHPHANGCRVVDGLVQEGRRWVWPPGTPRLPLMFSLVAVNG